MAMPVEKINTTDKFQIKSQLARLLAIENISIRHDPSLKTAGFDVKNRVLYIPNWTGISEYLYDMLLVHEVGHALNTPSEGWGEAIDSIAAKNGQDKNMRAKASIKDFLNVVEDARIDKLQKRRYPGSKSDYIVGYKELFERDFFGIKGRNVNALSFIDRANIYFKAGAHIIVNFSNEEKVFIKRMERLETFEEVIALAAEIYEFSKQNCTTNSNHYIEDEDGDEYLIEDENGDVFMEMDDETEGEDNSGEGDENESEEGGEDDGDATDGDDPGDSEDGKDSDSGDAEDDEDSEEDQSGEKSKSNKGHGGDLKDDDIVPESLTEQSARKSVESIVDSSSNKILHVKLPTFNEKVIQDYKIVLPRMRNAASVSRSYKYRYSDSATYGTRMNELDVELQEWKMREGKTISFMVKEFEMRKAAATYAKIATARTGVIDTNRLHSYKYNDDIFRRAMTIPKGKNHGFVMLIDWSGSMERNIKSTLKQLYTLVMFCKKVQIPFEVYFFRLRNGACPDDVQSPQSYGANELVFSAFAVCNILSSRMNANELNEAMRLMYYNGDLRIGVDTFTSTPLNQSILVLDKIVNEFQKRNKIQIVSTIILTDGESDAVSSWGQQNPVYNYQTGRCDYANYMLEDPQTKQTYFIDVSKRGWDRRGTTETFLKILKSRTNSHLIGFFIASRQREVGEVMSGDNMTPDQIKFWKDNHYLGLKNAGYDEYFVINVSAMERSTKMDENIPISSNMSMKRAAKVFQKFTENKTVNRSMLTNFIKWISSDIV